jgi:hypothetical protein
MPSPSQNPPAARRDAGGRARVRDPYADLLRDTRGLRREQAAARDAWFASLTWESKEEHRSGALNSEAEPPRVAEQALVPAELLDAMTELRTAPHPTRGAVRCVQRPGARTRPRHRRGGERTQPARATRLGAHGRVFRRPRRSRDCVR